MVAAVSCLLLLVRAFLLGLYAIPSGSMQHTLEPGDHVVVAKWRGGSDVQRGQVVVFDGSHTFGKARNLQGGAASWLVGAFDGHDPDAVYAKRVIGIGGDRVTCCDAQGRITVNGSPLAEPYLYPAGQSSEMRFDIEVPAGRLWLMGDHRSRSADSRSHMGSPGGGTVSVQDVIGPVLFRHWPLSRVGPVDPFSTGG